MQETKNSKGWALGISYVLVAFLIVDVVLLTLQNRELKNMLKGMTPMAQVEPLKPGEHIAAVKVQALSGETEELSYDDPTKKYLLFVLSTTCPHCEKTFPLWQSLASKKDDNCNIIGVCLQNHDETIKYADAKHVGFYMVTGDSSFSRRYKIGGVPETILLKGDGTVEKVWVGELTEDQANEIRKLMGV